MKRVSMLKTFGVLLATIAILVACTKEIEDVRLEPTLETAEVLNVKSDVATVVGFVIASGDGLVERGVCYNTQPSPTVDHNKVAYTGDAKTATFNVTLTGLNFATKYYARAYAITNAGVIYGEEFSFTTLPILPTVTSKPVTDIAGTSATTGGNVTHTGGADITARGVVYGTAPNPTIANSRTTDGTGAGEFTSLLTGLSGLTKYYVRAYATNSAGTAYGEEIEFTTLVSIRTWYLPGDYVEASYPGSGLANWSPDKSPYIKSREAAPDNLEGYVYMANVNNMFKITANPNWNGPNYGVGGPGLLDPNGSDISLPKGYYKFNVNATTLAYTAVNTNWGVVGSATPGSWNTDSPLQYYPASRTWMGGVSLVVGEFKFRANNDWGLNYGSSAGDNTLNQDGSNIPISVAGDYFFIMDLSKPFEYTYSANRWALIGDATPGGWSNDTFMSWDPVTKSMKIIVNLNLGEFKFRANGGWDVNLGGTTDDLTFGGPNIVVSEAGNYTIHLFPRADGGKFTITKN